VADRFYPKPARYFATLTNTRPIFQGDIFGGGFGAFWRHPVAVQAQLAGDKLPLNPQFATLTELISHVLVQGTGYVMILPQPCEYSEGGKGDTHPFRLVAPLFPLDRHANVDHNKVRDGLIGHTIWVPRWKRPGPQDFYVDLRLIASIDKTFLRTETRVAALSRAAWLSLSDRLSRYFVGVPLDAQAFSATQGSLYPESIGR
jgi:hypothetical protein